MSYRKNLRVYHRIGEKNISPILWVYDKKLYNMHLFSYRHQARRRDDR